MKTFIHQDKDTSKLMNQHYRYQVTDVETGERHWAHTIHDALEASKEVTFSAIWDNREEMPALITETVKGMV